jgi:hypothetical protein
LMLLVTTLELVCFCPGWSMLPGGRRRPGSPSAGCCRLSAGCLLADHVVGVVGDGGAAGLGGGAAEGVVDGTAVRRHRSRRPAPSGCCCRRGSSPGGCRNRRGTFRPPLSGGPAGRSRNCGSWSGRCWQCRLLSHHGPIGRPCRRRRWCCRCPLCRPGRSGAKLTADKLQQLANLGLEWTA